MRYKVVASRLRFVLVSDVLRQLDGFLSDWGRFVNERTGEVFVAQYTTNPIVYDMYWNFGRGDVVHLLLEEYKGDE